jgi:phage FluMu protein gp41
VDSTQVSASIPIAVQIVAVLCSAIATIAVITVVIVATRSLLTLVKEELQRLNTTVQHLEATVTQLTVAVAVLQAQHNQKPVSLT